MNNGALSWRCTPSKKKGPSEAENPTRGGDCRGSSSAPGVTCNTRGSLSESRASVFVSLSPERSRRPTVTMGILVTDVLGRSGLVGVFPEKGQKSQEVSDTVG